MSVYVIELPTDPDDDAWLDSDVVLEWLYGFRIRDGVLVAGWAY